MLKFAATTALVTILVAFGSACGGDEAPIVEERPLPPLNAFGEETAAHLRSIRDDISSIRGLPVNAEASEGWLTREAYGEWAKAGADDMTEDQRRELEAITIAWQLMHLTGPDADLVEEVTEFISDGVLGFWIGDEAALVVLTSGEIREPDAVTLAHEYVHSFQGAAFRAFEDNRWTNLLDPEENGEANTEYAATLSCVYEGDASVAEVEYARHAFGDRWLDVYTEAKSPDVPAAEDEPASDPSPALTRYFLFDYSECARFARHIYDNGGWEAVNALYERPPATTEQVLHPEKYQSEEPPSGLEPVDLALGVSWERLHQGTFGEFDVYNYLLTALTPETALQQALDAARALADSGHVSAEQAALLRALDHQSVYEEARMASAVAAEGWGAGWLSVYRRPGYEGSHSSDEGQEILLHISLEWDSEDDLWEFLGVYERALNVMSDYSYELVGERGPARWHGPTEYGELSWDETSRRADILLATRRPILEAAAGSLEEVSETEANAAFMR